MNRYLIIFFLTIFHITTSAQTATHISGQLQDAKNASPIPGATIYLTQQNDTTKRTGTISNAEGKFSIAVKPGTYTLRASFIGYSSFSKTIKISGQKVVLPTIKLSQDKIMLDEVKVVRKTPPVLQKGDTTEYNPLGYKVNPDATTKQLVSKMHGVRIIDGKLMVNGEEVKEVLVDGKKFFDDDVNKALETIPQDVVSKIKVYKYKSDEAKLTGMQEKDPAKTLNIVTKSKGKGLMFGDIGAGIGRNGKYVAEGKFNHFKKSHKLSVTAKSNNINAPLRISSDQGAMTINGNEIQRDEFATNFNLIEKANISASYNFNRSDSRTKQESTREFIAQPSTGLINKNETNKTNDSKNHRITLRWKQMTNSKSKYRFSFYNSLTLNESEGGQNSHLLSTKMNAPVNSTTSSKVLDKTKLNFNSSFYLSRQLGKKGRYIGLRSSYYTSNNSQGENRFSETINENNEKTIGVNNKFDKESKLENYSAGLSFSDNYDKMLYYTVGYHFKQTKNTSDGKTFDFDPQTNSYSHMDTSNSNRFTSQTKNNQAEFHLSFKKKKYRAYTGVDISHRQLINNEEFPEDEKFQKDYVTYEPYVSLSRKQKGMSLMLRYHCYTRLPSVSDLQELVDLSNPMFIRAGNSNLEPTNRHRISLFYSSSNSEKGSMIMVDLSASFLQNIIANETQIAHEDTTILGKYFLPTGGQFSRPVNLDGKYSLNGHLTLGFPINSLKSNLEISSGATFSETPGIINGYENRTTQLNFDQGIKLTSNISEKVDFTVNTDCRYSINEGGITVSQSNYYSQSSDVNLYWNFYRKLIFRSSVLHSYTGKSSRIKASSRWYMNLSISSKLFKSNKGEISFAVYDLLNEENSLQRSVTDTYIQENFSPRMNKYYMLSFTYKLRNTDKEPPQPKKRRRYLR